VHFLDLLEDQAAHSSMERLCLYRRVGRVFNKERPLRRHRARQHVEGFHVELIEQPTQLSGQQLHIRACFHRECIAQVPK
jgi:hypothetical protein